MRWYLILLLSLAGCELQPGDLFGSDNGAPADSGATAETTDAAVSDQVGYEVAAPLAYRYVRIDDLSLGDTGSVGGADIDAIVLTKPAGVSFTVGEVISYQPAADAMGEIASVLGSADATVGGVCDEYGASVALGGLGGVLVVRFDVDLEQGDTLVVHEVGGCLDEESELIEAEPISVQVGTSPDLDDAHWFILGSSLTGPAASTVIPALPAVY